LRVESTDADWYLRGWCHTREAVRTFRLDRMSSPALTELAATHGARDITLPDVLFEGSPGDLFVTIDVASAALPLLADYLPDTAGSRAATGPEIATPVASGFVRTTVRVSHYHGLKRLIASLPGVATVIAPAEARAAVLHWASAGVARYQRRTRRSPGGAGSPSGVL
jgi:proteasome accessory factor C